MSISVILVHHLGLSNHWQSEKRSVASLPTLTTHCREASHNRSTRGQCDGRYGSGTPGERMGVAILPLDTADLPERQAHTAEQGGPGSDVCLHRPMRVGHDP